MGDVSHGAYQEDQESLEMQLGLFLDWLRVMFDVIVCRRLAVGHLLLEHVVVHDVDVFRCHVAVS